MCLFLQLKLRLEFWLDGILYNLGIFMDYIKLLLALLSLAYLYCTFPVTTGVCVCVCGGGGGGGITASPPPVFSNKVPVKSAQNPYRDAISSHKS